MPARPRRPRAPVHASPHQGPGRPQAIDRTHRIGQKNQVMAYRLITKDTVEEKIRALQREKAALAAAVVQEESLATVMDLESLRRILG